VNLILRLLVVLGLLLAIPACGTKDDLLLPNGKESPKGQKDPSRPQRPIGQ
jgi:predicted small lipoprotein YifL